MSPARQTNVSPGGRKIARQPPIRPIFRTERNGTIPRVAARKRRDFDPHAFLATIGEGRKSVLFRRKQGIFAQGDAADSVFYIQTGKVKLTVVSKAGKEATIGILGDGNFFGEGSLAGQTLRMNSASAMTDCAVLQIDKLAMMEVLHREHELSDLFVAYLLSRNIRYEEDPVSYTHLEPTVRDRPDLGSHPAWGETRGRKWRRRHQHELWRFRSVGRNHFRQILQTQERSLLCRLG